MPSPPAGPSRGLDRSSGGRPQYLSGGGGSPVSVCSSMAANRRGQMGHPDGDSRVQARVYGSSTGNGGCPSDSFTHIRSKEGGSTQGSPSVAAQESSLSSSGTQSSTGLFSHILSSTKEVGRLETNYKFTPAQSLHQTSKVSHGNASNSSQVTNQELLGNFNRLAGCVPPYPNSHIAPQMVAFQDWRSNLRIPLSPIRFVYSPPGIYPGCFHGSGVSQASGYHSPCIPRRLVDYSGFSSARDSTHTVCNRDGGKVGIYNQLGEIKSDSHTMSIVPGGTTRSCAGTGDAVAGESGETADVGTVTIPLSFGDGVHLAPSTGSHGEHGGCSPMVPPQNAPSTVAPQLPLSAEDSRSIASGSGFSINPPRVNVVDGGSKPTDRGGVSCPKASASSHHGRFNARLGGACHVRKGKRTLEQGGSVTSHKCVGAFSGRKVAKTPLSHVSRSSSPREVRQCHDGVLHQQTGGHKVSHTMSTHQETAPVVHRARDHVVRDTHSRQRQRVGRQSVTRDSVSSHGVVTGSSNHRGDLSSIMDANNRSLRDTQQSSTSSLLLPSMGRSGVRSGCDVHQLDGAVGVRVSADINDPQGPVKDVDGGVYAPSHSSVLAETAVVHTASPLFGGRPKNTASYARSSQNVRNKGKVSRRKKPAFNCMDVIKRRYMQAGLSEQAAELVAKGRRESTLKVYSARLRPFVKWCDSRAICPDRASVSQIADFLLVIFKSGLQASTVRGYLSAIIAIHVGTPSGESIKHNDTLKLLIEGMHNSAPPRRNVWPEWDLGTVLDALNQHPYEPMLSATIRDTAIKTAFLIAISSGRRASEIHALAIGSHAVFSRRGVTLYFRPKFLAKNERSNFKAAPISLPRLPDSIGNRRFSCPVRSLKWYLSKTQSIRGDISHLFVTSTKPYKPAAKATISGWVVEAIVKSKAVLGPNKPNAHSTRAMASTQAFSRGLSIQDITNTVSWKTQHVFISTYLKDVPPQSTHTSFAASVLTSSTL